MTVGVNRSVSWIARNWILVFAVIFGLYIVLPFLAPVFMQIGLPGLGRAVHAVYSTQCHQLPDRSFFLFGPQFSYSLEEIQAAGQPVSDANMLRHFIGSQAMGWKVAWSDRMVSMYTSLFLFALAWWPLRGRVRALPFWGLVLFLLPMGIDGLTHFISDLSGGISGGFRYDNAWLAALTGNSLPVNFYQGNSVGSFNSWMRLLTGVLFGIGMVWFAFPRIQAAFDDLPANQTAPASAGSQAVEPLPMNEGSRSR